MCINPRFNSCLCTVSVQHFLTCFLCIIQHFILGWPLSSRWLWCWCFSLEFTQDIFNPTWRRRAWGGTYWSVSIWDNLFLPNMMLYLGHMTRESIILESIISELQVLCCKCKRVPVSLYTMSVQKKTWRRMNYLNMLKLVRNKQLCSVDSPRQCIFFFILLYYYAMYCAMYLLCICAVLYYCAYVYNRL